MILHTGQNAQLASTVTPLACASLTTSRVSSMFSAKGSEEPSIMTLV